MVVNDHSLTAGKIARFVRDQRPELQVQVKEKMAKINVDKFIRAEGSKGDDIISFFLQADYMNLSDRARAKEFTVAKKHSKAINGKYFIDHPCNGITISSK